MDLFGSPNFDRMAKDHDYDNLYRYLEHRDKLVRIQAARTLAELNDGAGWRVLMDLARQSSDADLQQMAVEMLGELGHPRAVPLLGEILFKARFEATNSDLVSAAREALETIGGAQAVEALEHAGYRTDETEPGGQADFEAEYVRPILPRTDQIRLLSAEEHLNNAVQLREAESAERGLVEVSLALWLSPQWAYAWYLRGVLMEDLDRYFEASLAYQRALYFDPTLTDAREALNELKNEESSLPLEMSDLLNGLSDRDWKTRRDAAAGLGELALAKQVVPEMVVDSLIEHLADEDREVRHAVIEALSQLDDRRAVLPLLAQNESSWLVRFAILHALAHIGSLDGLVSALHREMKQIQERNPVFSSHKDPLLEVEYDLLMEIGVRALERTGDIEGLLLLAEGNAWEEINEDGSGDIDGGYADEEVISPGLGEIFLSEEEEADEDLEYYVDEVAQMAAAALERLVQERLVNISAELLNRIREVPDLTLMDASEPDADPVIVYDLSSLRQTAANELQRRKSASGKDGSTD